MNETGPGKRALSHPCSTVGMPGAMVDRGGSSSVLEDPSGNRARWLRRAGRVVFVVFLAWLLAIVLGGLGLMPVAGIPLTHSLRPSQGPPVLPRLPKPRPPSASDLRPALPAAVVTAGAPSATRRASHGKSATAPGKTKTTPAGTRAHGHSATAPGQTKTTPATGSSRGKSVTAPGKTKTTTTLPLSKGKSTVTPRRVKTTTSVTTTTLPANHGQSKKP
jgi:hypothetical protein